MKKSAIIVLAVYLLSACGTKPESSQLSLPGAWQVVKAKYGKGDFEAPNQSVVKIFTNNRWVASYYNKDEKFFDGAGGGKYELNGNEYTEYIEYFSWDSVAVGQSAKFTMKLEDGLLHQYGKIVYKGDTGYIIDEWYKRLD
jgi:hypothetical protein